MFYYLAENEFVMLFLLFLRDKNMTDCAHCAGKIVLPNLFYGFTFAKEVPDLLKTV